MNKLQREISLALIGLLLLLCLPAAISWRALDEIAGNSERSSVANEVLQAHMMLGMEADRMRHFLEKGGRTDDPVVQKHLDSIAEHAAHIRGHIGEEIGIIGKGGAAEEADEFTRLDRILRQIALTAQGTSTGTTWSNEIDEAIAHEHEELDEMEQENAASLVQIRFFMLVAMVVVGLVLIVGAIWLRIAIVRPTVGLLQGMQQLLAGERSYRIKPNGIAAMQGLQRTFNKLAEQLAQGVEAVARNRKELEDAVANRSAELRKVNAELMQSSERRTQFLADISHELRTPLAIISGETDVALRNPDAPAAEHRNSLARVRDQARDMARLVDDLLFMARNEAGPAAARLKPVSLLPLIKTVTGSLQPLLAADGGTLEFRSDMSSARMLGDEGRLRQLLIILLDNAVHYSEHAPDIVVTLEQARDGFLISVEDKGNGIDPVELPHVFERFRRGKRGAEQNGDGTGLGLPLAKAIAESHGGSITIESAEGVGTKVVVLLPEATTGSRGS